MKAVDNGYQYHNQSPMPRAATDPVSALQRMQDHRERTHCPQGHLLVVAVTGNPPLRRRHCPPCDQVRREENQKKSRERTKRKVRAIHLLGGVCQDCKQTFPDNPEVFDFDHVEGEKTANISLLLSTASWGKIAVELLKCELVCSNCHRMRTKERFVGHNGL